MIFLIESSFSTSHVSQPGDHQPIRHGGIQFPAGHLRAPSHGPWESTSWLETIRWEKYRKIWWNYRTIDEMVGISWNSQYRFSWWHFTSTSEWWDLKGFSWNPPIKSPVHQHKMWMATMWICMSFNNKNQGGIREVSFDLMAHSSAYGIKKSQYLILALA